MIATKRLALGVASIALGGGVTLAGVPAATAAPAAPARTAQSQTAQGDVSAHAKCSKWLDYAYGRGRAHAKCPGYYVQVTVKCGNGKKYNSKPYWRDGYNKAECPKGVGAIGMSGKLY
ncbi:hypothetical protein [Streptomyces sp. MZ04]|uniref:hypothetical protein n=1 Tax=Streptomyces sp. MZ04 TaxID=2559236 RepID=UPI00107ED56D|nr:hypothetical protein [Streptomyces sp. MZ04]TGB14623.1 hypothetical protein E2651_05140 [Streptomyces sp. MZ04]